MAWLFRVGSNAVLYGDSFEGMPRVTSSGILWSRLARGKSSMAARKLSAAAAGGTVQGTAQTSHTRVEKEAHLDSDKTQPSGKSSEYKCTLLADVL